MESRPFVTVSCAALLMMATGAVAAQPPKGLIVVDPNHPAWLMRQGGKHVFVCGPGDPEGFLYLGTRRGDGTRQGPQEALIRKLVRHGGNCIYLQAVRSHGGDGGKDENPFVDSDPAKGLDEDILKQWEGWFDLMDAHGILIYLFLYDDSADPFGPKKAKTASEPERRFARTLAKRFARYRNLIWIVAEESEEALTHERVRDLARVIRAANPPGRLVGCHHHSGTAFKAWQRGGPLNHYAMQLNLQGDAAHRGAVEAFGAARGKYQVIYAENTTVGADPADLRHFAWSAAMGGTMPMLIRVDIESTPATLLQQCRHLQRFFEATDFCALAPHDELAGKGATWVLADPGHSYIAYAHGRTRSVGLQGPFPGPADLLWLDCVTGKTLSQRGVKAAGPQNPTWPKPAGFGDETAVWIRKAAANSSRAGH